MNMFQRGFSLAGVAAMVGGGAVLGLGTVYAVGKKFESFQSMVDNQITNAIRAVPGERYLRLIDDLHGENKDAREKAQRFLSSLAGIKLDADYEASMQFGYDMAKPVDAQLIPLPVVSPEAIDNYLESHESLMRYSSTISPVPTVADLRERMVENRFNQVEIALQLARASCSMNMRREPRKVYCRSGGGDPYFSESLASAIEAGVDADLRAFHQGSNELRLGAEPRSIAWKPLRDYFLVVVVPEEHVRAHEADACHSDGKNSPLPAGKGCLRLWVHRAGDPAALAFKNDVWIHRDEFMRNPPLKTKFNGSTLRYAFRNPDPSSVIDPETLARMDEYAVMYTKSRQDGDKGRKGWFGFLGGE